MPLPGNPSFEERRRAALEAKEKLLKKLKTAAPSDETVKGKLAERKAAADARQTRRTERDAKKKQEEAEAASAASTSADVAEAENSEPVESTKEALDAGKAERDRRYAARKARRR